jgi:hypothetical protein
VKISSREINRQIIQISATQTLNPEPKTTAITQIRPIIC